MRRPTPRNRTCYATTDYGTPSRGAPLSFTGRVEIVEFPPANLGSEIVTGHA